MNIFKKKVISYRGETVYEWSPLRITFAAIAGVLILILLLTCISSVPTGYTGILTTFGKVEDGTLDAGVHFKAPWQRIVKLDNRTQKVEITCQAFSADIQQVDLKMSINFCIDKTTAQNLYRTVGEKYYDTILYPRILENTKAVFAKYTAEDLIANRQALSAEIQDALMGEASEYGITVVNFNVEDIDFTDAFTNAVEAKQVAAQNKLTAETEQAQKLMETQAAADMKRINAEADADAQKTKADADAYAIKIKAEAEAEANAKINKSLTETLINYIYANNWNGEYPLYFGGNNALIDLRPNTLN